MSSHDTAPRRRATHSADQPGNVSRRRLLTSGAAAAALATLPALAGETRAAAGKDGADTRNANLTAEQRRLAAVLELYGPELGSRR